MKDNIIEKKVSAYGVLDMKNKIILPEIQGLRAIAVISVVLFHIWPSLLPGGYVGVDVFFVISGYLITGMLIRSAIQDGKISLVDFYARRARRLLPAAMLVLFVTFVGMLTLIPMALWEETGVQIVASAIYVQNWVVAWLEIDYLGSENIASPVQHFWSLSIEEQFYFVWPLVMITVMGFSRRIGMSLQRLIFLALSAIFFLSFYFSLVVTNEDKEWAYFATHTRMWELALGGLLALVIHRIRVGFIIRYSMAFFGLLAILYSSVCYGKDTLFPGFSALLPTMGAVLIIVSGNVSLGRVGIFDSKIISYIGDRSYSIYLWHWPLLIFYLEEGARLGMFEGVGIISLTLMLSHFSYKYIEQRYRHPRHHGEWRPLGYAAASILVCILLVGVLHYNSMKKPVVKVEFSDPNYPGPAALLGNIPAPEGVELIPPLAQIKHDLPVVYSEKCHQNQDGAAPVSCTLGNIDGERTIVIVGDSHAAQWVPPLDEIARQRGFRLLTFTKSACAFSEISVTNRGAPYRSCYQWRENVMDEIRELKPDMVILGQARNYPVDDEEMMSGVHRVWNDLVEVGARVVAIEDTPRMPFLMSNCLESNVHDCFALRREAESPKLFTYLAEGIDDVQVIDMTDTICGLERCEAQVGNIIVWRDRHHLTATYARSLAPYLAQRLGL